MSSGTIKNVEEIDNHTKYCKDRKSQLQKLVQNKVYEKEDKSYDFRQQTRNHVHSFVNEKEEDPILKRIKATIIQEKPKVKFSEVCGLEKQVEELKQAVLIPTQYPHIFSNRTPFQSFLFYGPPGTGKTYLAKAVAAEMNNITFFSVSASSLISKYQGESELCIKVLCNVARSKKPSVIFFDEVDSLGLSRTDTDNDSSRRIKTELFIQMDGLEENAGVFVMAATNTPFNIDSALLRRFDKLLYVPLPDKLTRYKMLQQRLSNEGISEDNLQILAAKTEGFSGSDINKLCKNALMEPISKPQQSEYCRKSFTNRNGEVIYTQRL